MAQPLSPPQAPRYLDEPYSSSQKGGTLIAEDVTDLKTHEQRLSDPDAYRPRCCPRCGHDKLHRHGFRDRKLWGERGEDLDGLDNSLEEKKKKEEERPGEVIKIVRHRCANAECKACWQTVPALLARCLWRRWVVVEAATVGRRPHNWPPVPPRTRRRWMARLRAAARVLTRRWPPAARRTGRTWPSALE